jgi:hypothetical protein
VQAAREAQRDLRAPLSRSNAKGRILLKRSQADSLNIASQFHRTKTQRAQVTPGRPAVRFPVLADVD